MRILGADRLRTDGMWLSVRTSYATFTFHAGQDSQVRYGHKLWMDSLSDRHRSVECDLDRPIDVDVHWSIPLDGPCSAQFDHP